MKMPTLPMSFCLAIDHTCLKSDAKPQDIELLCDEAKTAQFLTVCIRSEFLSLAKSRLIGSKVKVITVIGFPTGLESTPQKLSETEIALARGAEEIDMVLNINDLKNKNLSAVENEITAIAKLCGSVPLKVILETCLLTDEEKVIACKLAETAGAAFVKTSTGFSTGGATVNDVKLMRSSISPRVQVKASGGIRTLAQMKAMLGAGATRIGTSNGVSILKEALGETAIQTEGTY